jgi:mono/diheme cytochrome c family protein
LFGIVIVATVLGHAVGCGEVAPADDAAGAVAGDSSLRSAVLPRARPLTDVTFEATPARLARGRYLAENVLMCIRCHSEPDSSVPGLPPRAGREGAGRIVWEDDGFRMVAPNLTPDSATGAGSWSDDALARAIREGVGHDGRALSRPMYWLSFRGLHDEDLASVIAYLRSLPALRNPLPERNLSPERVANLAEGPDPLTQRVGARDLSDPIQRGRYLVEVADCIGCHTAYTDRTPGAFGGGNWIGDGREAWVFSSNITHDSSGIGGWGEEGFIQVMRTGKGGTLDPVMPWVVFRGMTNEDLGAIYQALGEAPHARHWMDNTSPPTYCPVCGQEHGLGERNQPMERAAVSVPEALLAEYEGFYEGVYAEGGFYSNAGPGYPYRVEIRLRDGSLWATDGSPEWDQHGETEEMLSLSETRFFRPAEGETIEFERDGSGAGAGYRARYGLDEWVMLRERDG